MKRSLTLRLNDRSSSNLPNVQDDLLPMTTTLDTTDKLLVYDGDCPMCLASVQLLHRYHLVRPEQTKSNLELTGADLDAAKAAGIRNQLVVLDPKTRGTRIGSDALLWIIGDNLGHPWWVRLLGLPGVRSLVRFGYQAVSYNRRIISPPKHQIVCDCEPEVTVARRMRLVVPLLVVALLVLAGFGAATAVTSGTVSAAWGALIVPSATAVAWLALLVIGVALLGGLRGLDYASHAAVALFAGSWPLVPALSAPWLPQAVGLTLIGVAVLARFITMFRMQRTRVAAQGLSVAWLVLWVVAIVSAAAVGGVIMSLFA